MEGLHAELLEKLAQLDCLKTELYESKLESCRLEEQLRTSDQLVKDLKAQQQMLTVLINEQKASLTAADEEKLQLEKMVNQYKDKTELLTAENSELKKSLDALEAQHQDAIQQLVASRAELAASNRDLSLHLVTRSEAINEFNMDYNYELEDKPAKDSSSSSSSVLSVIAQASASDAANLVEAEDCTRDDLMLSCIKTEQSPDTDGELKSCRDELQLIMMEREKSHNYHIAQLSAKLESCLLEKNDECSDCSSKDCLIDELNTRTQLLADEVQQRVADLECCRGQLEEEKRRCRVEVTQLRDQVEEFTTKLRRADEQPAIYADADSQGETVIATLKAEIVSLKEILDEKESVCQLYESEVERLSGIEDRLTKEIDEQQEVLSQLQQQKVVSSTSANVTDEIFMLNDQLSTREHELKGKIEENTRLQQKVEEMFAELEQLRNKLLEATPVNGTTCPYSNNEVRNENQTLEIDLATAVEHSNEISNGEPHQSSNNSVSSDSKGIVQLRSTISQQKEMLDVLNSKYASLRGLLEDRSQALHGSSVLSSVHQLELELHEVKADRERLLAVLGEKTRESSALRAEAHRLTTVVAASQAALSKAQRDAQQVAAQSQHETNQDMKNEAVKKLSQMIKDKDMEIDALQLKNATLVQVRIVLDLV